MESGPGLDGPSHNNQTAGARYYFLSTHCGPGTGLRTSHTISFNHGNPLEVVYNVIPTLLNEEFKSAWGKVIPSGSNCAGSNGDVWFVVHELLDRDCDDRKSWVLCLALFVTKWWWSPQLWGSQPGLESLLTPPTSDVTLDKCLSLCKLWFPHWQNGNDGHNL